MADKEKKEKKKLFDNISNPFSKIKKDAASGAKKNNKRHDLIEGTSYEFSPSFIYHNGKVASIVQLYVRKASNRMMSFTDVLDIIPTNPREDVKIYLMEVDGVIRDDEKKSIVKQNAASGRDVIENEDKNTGDSLPGLGSHKKDASEIEMDRSDIEDYYTYELTLDSPEPVVYYKFQLVVVGNSAESVEEQIKDLNTILDQRHAGMKWDSLAGDQIDRFRELFARLDKKTDGSVDTSTGSNYAGINFAASPGLCDARGVIIGDDVLSLVQSAAVFDFDGSTKELGVIAIPASEQIGFYEKDTLPHISASSIVAQAAANDIVMSGHRAAHLVLNDFDYMNDDRNFLRTVSPVAFKTYDVSKMTINPMQGFGRIDDVVAIYSRLIQKITNIFDLLDNLSFERDSEGSLHRSLVLEAVNGFYLRHGLWTSDAGVYPYRTNIVEVKHPELYPTMGILTQEFTTMEDEARHKGSATQADRSHALHSILSQSLDAALDVLGRTTSIHPSNALQTYYNFSALSDVKMIQVQLVNILDYVIYMLNPGDVLVIHGADNIYKYVMNNMIHQTIKAAQKRGVRVIMSFDTITSPKTNDFDLMNMSDVFSLRGPYYTDFGSDVSWSIMGAMLDEEVNQYAHIMNNAELSDSIKIQATARGMCQGLLHRDIGRVNNFIRLMPII